METRRLGRTELQVTPLGYGLAEIDRQDKGGRDISASGRVLEAVLDSGINFLDTASGYGITEELIGETISHRRGEYVLATKFGPIYDDASARGFDEAGVTESIDQSLRRMKTDRVDIIQLQYGAPDTGLLAPYRDEIIDAMIKAREAGKVRFLGFAGDNDSAEWAVECGEFDALQTTFNLVDQRARKGLFASAREKDIGLIIKRPLANGIWARGLFELQDIPDDYPEAWINKRRQYNERVQAMKRVGPIPGEPDDPTALALAFVFAHEADTVIVGTHNPSHLSSNIELVENGGPDISEAVAELHRRFDLLGDDWEQVG